MDLHTCQSPRLSKGKELLHSHTPEGYCQVNCGESIIPITVMTIIIMIMIVMIIDNQNSNDAYTNGTYYNNNNNDVENNDGRKKTFDSHVVMSCALRQW